MSNAASYLATMRAADGKSIADVAAVLRMLKLAGFNRPWPSSAALDGLLMAIEEGRSQPTAQQVISLSIAFPFSLYEYRRRAALEVVRG